MLHVHNVLYLCCSYTYNSLHILTHTPTVNHMHNTNFKHPIFQLVSKDRTVVLKGGDLLTELENREVLRSLIEQLPEQSPLVIVDLSHLEFINSVGLSFLISLRREVRHRDGEMCIVTEAPAILKILWITKLYDILRSYTTISEAVKKIATPTGLSATSAEHLADKCADYD